MFLRRARSFFDTFICLVYWSCATAAMAATPPMAPAQLAVYQGADREKILIDGAKREGQFTLYTSHTWFKTFVASFEKKYPFVRATQWRNDSKNIICKVLEENKSGRAIADIVETTADGLGVLKREGLFQEYYSPEARFYPNELSREEKTASFICRTVKLTTAWGSTRSSFLRPSRRATSKT